MSDSSSSTSLPTWQELVQEFEFIGEWDEQCEYLIELGFELPKLPEESKNEQNRIHGCQSNVWLTSELDTSATPSRVRFLANSESMFVNGLIVVVNALYNDKPSTEVLSIDPEAALEELGMDQNLVPQRKNGLFGMIERIRNVAKLAVDHETSGQN